MAQFNQFGGVSGGFSSERIMPTGVMPPSGGVAPGGGGSSVYIPTAGAANAANLAFARGAMVSDPTYKAAQGFLNPNDPNAMYDVAMKGAEHAAGTGMVGSGIAGQYTGRLRQYDIERRAALGNQLLSGAYGRTPAPVNPYAQAQLQLEKANEENKRLLASIQGRYAPSGGMGFSQGGGGGGGRSAPMMIGGMGGGGMAGVGGYQQVQPYAPTSGGFPAGSDQVAYGLFGPSLNANQQRSQLGPNGGDWNAGITYMGPNVDNPEAGVPFSQLSFEEQRNLYE